MKRVALKVSQRKLAHLAGLPLWRVPWAEQGLRTDYTDAEYAALKGALARVERAQREAERVLSR